MIIKEVKVKTVKFYECLQNVINNFFGIRDLIV